MYWQRRSSCNYTEFWPETLNALGESPAHYGTEAKIAPGKGDEVIGGIESSPREQLPAAQAETAEGKTAAIEKV